MFDHAHYVPILKGKRAEYDSLRELSPETKAALTPLIEIPPIPWDFEQDEPAKTIDQHLAPVAKSLDDAWAGDRPFFIDLLWIPDTEVMNDGRQPLSFLCDAARERNLRLIPVTGTRRAEGYQGAVRDAVRADNLGFCIRIEGEDLADLARLRDTVDNLLEFVALTPRETDLLIDFNEIPAAQVGPMLIAANSVIGSLPYVTEWRTLTLAGSAFPLNLARFDPQSVNTVQRAEWIIWQAIANRRDRLPRLPTFGDYGINHPEPSDEVDPRLMRMSANLRYTIDEAWLVLKGRNTRDYGFAQFGNLCRYMIRRPEYRGPDFSWGDRYISDCAANAVGPGNATTWRKIGTTHHLTTVTTQIANVAEP